MLLFKHNIATTKEFERLERKINRKIIVSATNNSSITNPTSSNPVSSNLNVLGSPTSSSNVIKISNVSSSPYTVLDSDNVILCDTNTKDITINLPLIFVVKELVIKKINYNYAVIVKPYYGNKIDGLDSMSIAAKSSIRIVSYGTDWWVI